MTVLADGASTIVHHWRLVLVLFSLVIIGYLVVHLTMHAVFKDILDADDYFALGLSGSIIPILFLSFIYWRWGFVGLFPPAFVLLLALLRYKTGPKPAPAKWTLFIALFFLFALFVRLGFVSKAIFPSYFDSAEHYMIIKNLVEENSPGTFRYYHIGFHVLLAFIVFLSHAGIISVMLVFGQVILAILPFPMYFPVRQITGSNTAGILAVALSAFGWSIPAHAVDWGKYPALFSIGIFPFVLGLACLFIRNKNSLAIRIRYVLLGLISFGLVASILVHSRMLIIFVMAFMVMAGMTTWDHSSFARRRMIIGILVLTLVVETAFIAQNRILSPLFEPYIGKGLGVTICALALSIIAWKRYSAWVVACVLTICLWMGCMFVPVDVPGYGVLSLLDRPFVEMLIFIPLSVLGGLGLAVLEGRFSTTKISVLLIGLIVLHAFASYPFYPDDCCELVGNDDVAALTWVQDQLPVGARIGISSTQLNVTEIQTLRGIAGSDAGIWITPITEMRTVLLSHTTEFDKENILTFLCDKAITHLFVGEKGIGFDMSGIDSRPEWYRPLLSFPGTGVYEVTGCN